MKNVDIFLNCPFDSKYDSLMDVILFTIIYCGYEPRCSREDSECSASRLEKIVGLIKESFLSIHDLSCVELDDNILPRFNMPFEFGIFWGIKESSLDRDKYKCLVFEKDSHQLKKYLSDYSGRDPVVHGGSPEKCVICVRNWLDNIRSPKKRPLVSGREIFKAYNVWLTRRAEFCSGVELDIGDLSYKNNLEVIKAWLVVLNRKVLKSSRKKRTIV